MKTKSTTLVFDLEQPLNLSTLICCRLKLLDPNLNKYFSAYQAQKEVCRRLILNNSNIFACPCIGDDEIYLLLKRCDLNSQSWPTNLEQIGIKIIGEDVICDQILASLVWYSVMVRVSPNWNRVDSYFVQGRNFLSDIGRTSHLAVEFKVLSKNINSLTFLMKAHEICLHPVNYGLINDAFLNERREKLLGTWCRVLPKMSRGIIVSVDRYFPDSCPLGGYEGLKNYWFNLYGYCLPEDPKDLLFYDVFFKAIRREPFCYPSCCVMVSAVEILNESADNYLSMKTSLMKFSFDFQSNIGDLCQASNLCLRQFASEMDDETFVSQAKMRSQTKFKSADELFQNNENLSASLPDLQVMPMDVEHSYSKKPDEEDVSCTGSFDLEDIDRGIFAPTVFSTPTSQKSKRVEHSSGKNRDSPQKQIQKANEFVFRPAIFDSGYCSKSLSSCLQGTMLSDGLGSSSAANSSKPKARCALNPMFVTPVGLTVRRGESSLQKRNLQSAFPDDDKENVEEKRKRVDA